ncbi:uncharacterized protein K444DRAFT_278763 [Hyaloscypha bicolor E]|uniref:Uncharacterized protein n=1 Tax=Hyaloscypha bicolor E TaxID=1095630 RepID=A0A2J6SGY4_9HELO|nr:uncharacterized protein K444DRAFT_278763 [Hyaloscypha bicolor E]PMD50007.1 hypothetical protein K444DRAFT_278763 [Hyaloscypha bicolor E]
MLGVPAGGGASRRKKGLMYSMGNVCFSPIITSLDLIPFAHPVFCLPFLSRLQVQLSIVAAQHVRDAASRMATTGCARLTSGEGYGGSGNASSSPWTRLGAMALDPGTRGCTEVPQLWAGGHMRQFLHRVLDLVSGPIGYPKPGRSTRSMTW